MESKIIGSFIQKGCKLDSFHHKIACLTNNNGNTFSTNKMLFDACGYIKRRNIVDMSILFPFIKRTTGDIHKLHGQMYQRAYSHPTWDYIQTLYGLISYFYIYEI